MQRISMVALAVSKLDTHCCLRPDVPRSSEASGRFDICHDDLRALGWVGSGLNSVCMIGGRRGWSGRVVSAQCVCMGQRPVLD